MKEVLENNNLRESSLDKDEQSLNKENDLCEIEELREKISEIKKDIKIKVKKSSKVIDEIDFEKINKMNDDEIETYKKKLREMIEIEELKKKLSEISTVTIQMIRAKYFINVEDLSDIMGLGTTYTYELVKSEVCEFKVLMFGKRILIPTNSFLKWYNSLAED